MQELIDLRDRIQAGRYDEALAIVDELEEMGKQAILRNIESFLVPLLVRLIKNQVERRLTNVWAASISDSIRQIQKLNLKDNKKSNYIKEEDWYSYLEEAIEAAFFSASVEVLGGELSPIALSKRIDRLSILNYSKQLLALTYQHSSKALPMVLTEVLSQLPGGEDWKFGRR